MHLSSRTCIRHACPRFQQATKDAIWAFGKIIFGWQQPEARVTIVYSSVTIRFPGWLQLAAFEPSRVHRLRFTLHPWLFSFSSRRNHADQQRFGRKGTGCHESQLAGLDRVPTIKKYHAVRKTKPPQHTSIPNPSNQVISIFSLILPCTCWIARLFGWHEHATSARV